MKKIILFLILPLFSFIQNSEPISHIAVYNQILETGVEFPDIVFAQSVLESGHYKSKVFLLNNNMFGMKFPRKRETVAVGENLGYAVYDFWQFSIDDYLLYQKYLMRNKKFTRNQYLAHLDRYYASVPNYSKKLLMIISKFQKILYKVPSFYSDGDLSNNVVS